MSKIFRYSVQSGSAFNTLSLKVLFWTIIEEKQVLVRYGLCRSEQRHSLR